MGRFAEKYSESWRQAIREACCDHDMTPKAAVAAAKEGTLPGYPGMTFDMTLSRAQTLQTEENRRRRGLELEQSKGDPDARAQAIANRSLAIIEHQLRDLERKAKGGKLTADLVEKGRKLNGWAREAQALAARVAPSKGTGGAQRKRETAKPDAPNTSTDDGDGGLLHSMMRDHKTNRHTGTDTGASARVPESAAAGPGVGAVASTVAD